MAYRNRVSPSADKKTFARTASKTKDVNVKPKVMRGGTRL